MARIGEFDPQASSVEWFDALGSGPAWFTPSSAPSKWHAYYPAVDFDLGSSATSTDASFFRAVAVPAQTPDQAHYVQSVDDTNQVPELEFEAFGPDPGDYTGIRFRVAVQDSSGVGRFQATLETVDFGLFYDTGILNTAGPPFQLFEFDIGSAVADVVASYGWQNEFVDQHVLVRFYWSSGNRAQFGALEILVPAGPLSVFVKPDPAALSLGNPAPRAKITAKPSSAVLSLGNPAPTLKRTVKPSPAALSLGNPAPQAKITAKPSPAALSLGAPATVETRTLRPSPAALSLGVPATVEKITAKPAPAALSLGAPVPQPRGHHELAPDPAALQLGVPPITVRVTLKPAPASLALAAPASSTALNVSPAPAIVSLGAPIVSASSGPRIIAPDPCVLLLGVPPCTARVLKPGGIRATVHAGTVRKARAKIGISAVVDLEPISTRARR